MLGTSHIYYSPGVDTGSHLKAPQAQTSPLSKQLSTIRHPRTRRINVNIDASQIKGRLARLNVTKYRSFNDCGAVA